MGACHCTSMVSEPIGSRFPEEVAARQMVEIDVHSSRLRALQDDDESNDDDDQMSSQTWSRRVLEESKQRRSEDARARLCWTKQWMDRSIEEECWSKFKLMVAEEDMFLCAIEFI